MLKKHFLSSFLAVSSLFSGGIFAGSPDLFCASTPAFYVSTFYGASWLQSGKNTFVTFGGFNTNYYSASLKYKASAIGGVDVGAQWLWQEMRLFSILALETSYTQVRSPAGLVRPLFFVNSNFATLNNSYLIEAVPLFVVGKLGWMPLPRINPYVVAGLGVSWNFASDYNEVRTDPNSSASPMRAMFQSYRNTAFAYSLGFGLAVPLTETVSTSLEYRFTSYGEAKLLPSSIQTSTASLDLGMVRANAVFLNISAVI